MVDFEALARPGIQRLRAYDPGHDLVALRRRFVEAQLVELGSNENPYGASPRAKQAVVDALAGIHIYPDPLGGDLKRALARHHGIATANLLLGNGSHELLMQFAQVFAGPQVALAANSPFLCGHALWHETRIPLFNSGFWVFFKPASPMEMLTLRMMTTGDKVELGRRSYGLTHSNHIVYSLSRIFEMALAHVYATSVDARRCILTRSAST